MTLYQKGKGGQKATFFSIYRLLSCLKRQRKDSTMTKTSEMRMYLVVKRETLGLSMRETSRLAHMDFHHYYRIENGLIARVSFISLCNIAHVLEISLNDLFKMELIYQQKQRSSDLDGNLFNANIEDIVV